MKTKFQEYSINKYIIRCVIIITVMVSVCIIMYSTVYKKELSQQAERSARLSSENAQYRIYNALNLISNAASTVSYTTQVQTSLFTSHADAFFDSRNSTQLTLQLIHDSIPVVDGTYLLTTFGRNVFADGIEKSICRPVIVQNYPALTRKQSGFYSTTYDDVNYLVYLLNIQNMCNTSYMPTTKAACAMYVDWNKFINYALGEQTENSALVFTEGHDIIATSRNVTDSMMKAIQNDDQSTYIVYSNYIDTLGLNCNYIVSRAILSNDSALLYNIGLVFLISMTVTIITLLVVFLSLISKPIKRLASDVSCIGKGMYSTIRPAQITELAQLSDAINQMLSDIDASHEKEKRNAEIINHMMNEQNKARVYAYRSQVNPHFLFNTLEKLRSLAHHHNVPPLEEQVSALSSIFRGLLDMKLVVPIEDELRSVRGYFTICRQWVDYPVILKQSMNFETDKFTILSLSLQPIIENSLLHAFDKSTKKENILSISGKRSGNTIIITIADNGIGISNEDKLILEDTLNNGKEITSKHIGLVNINQRLKLAYGNDYGITIKSKYGYYTAVQLHIPAVSSFDGELLS